MEPSVSSRAVTMTEDFWTRRAQRQQQVQPEEEKTDFWSRRAQRQQAAAQQNAGIELPPEEPTGFDSFMQRRFERRQQEEQQQLEQQQRDAEQEALQQRMDYAGSHRQFIGESLKSWAGSAKEMFDVPIAVGKAGLERLAKPDFSGFDTPTGLSPLEQPATAEPMVPGWDAEGGGYDLETAKADGMEPDETGHMGSVVPVSSREVESGVPEGSYRMLKGKGHPTWDKAVEAEEARGFQIKKIGQYYYSVPLTAGLKDRPEIQADVTATQQPEISLRPEPIAPPEEKKADRLGDIRRELGLEPDEAFKAGMTEEARVLRQEKADVRDALARDDGMRQALIRINHEAGLTDATGKLDFDEAYVESLESNVLGKALVHTIGPLTDIIKDVLYDGDNPSYFEKLQYVRRLKDDGLIDENMAGYVAGALSGILLDVAALHKVAGVTSLSGPGREWAIKLLGGRGANILAAASDGLIADVFRARQREDEGPGTVLAGVVAGGTIGSLMKPARSAAELATEEAAAKALKVEQGAEAIGLRGPQKKPGISQLEDIPVEQQLRPDQAPGLRPDEIPETAAKAAAPEAPARESFFESGKPDPVGVLKPSVDLKNGKSYTFKGAHNMDELEQVDPELARKIDAEWDKTKVDPMGFTDEAGRFYTRDEAGLWRDTKGESSFIAESYAAEKRGLPLLPEEAPKGSPLKPPSERAPAPKEAPVETPVPKEAPVERLSATSSPVDLQPKTSTVSLTPAQRRVASDAGIKAKDMKDITPQQALDLRRKLEDAPLSGRDADTRARLAEKLKAIHEEGGLDYAEAAAKAETERLGEVAKVIDEPKAVPKQPTGLPTLPPRLADARLYRKVPEVTRVKQLVEMGFTPDQAKRVDGLVTKDFFEPLEAVDKVFAEIQAVKQATVEAAVKTATPAQKQAAKEAVEKVTKPKPKATPEQKKVIDEATEKVTKRQVTKADDYEDTGNWEIRDPDGATSRITYDKSGMKGTWSVVDEAGNKTALSATRKADAIEEALDLARKGAGEEKAAKAAAKGRDAKGRKKPKTNKPVSEDQIPSRKAAVEDPKVNTKQADQLSFLDEGGYAINLLDELPEGAYKALVGGGIVGGVVGYATGFEDNPRFGRVVDGFLLGIGVAAGMKGVGKMLAKAAPASVRIGMTAGGRLPGIIKEWDAKTLRAVQNAVTGAHGNSAEGQRVIASILGDLWNAADEVYGGGATKLSRFKGVVSQKNPFTNVPDDVAQNINAALHKGVDSAEWAAMPEPFQAPLLRMRNYIDELSEAFVREGVVDGPLALKFEQEAGLYVTRSFRIYTDPEWYRNAPKILGQENWDQIVKDFKDWYKALVEPINQNREYANWSMANRKLDFEDFKDAFKNDFPQSGLSDKLIRRKYNVGNRLGMSEFALANKGLDEKGFQKLFRKEFPDSKLTPKKVENYRQAAIGGKIKKAQLDIVPLDDEGLQQAYYAFMDKGNSLATGIKYGKMGKITADILKRRNTKLAVPVQKLWGVNDDAFVNFATAVTKQNDLLTSWRLQETLKEIGAETIDAEGNIVPGFLVKLDERGQIPAAAREKMFHWKVFDGDDIKYRPLKGYAMPMDVFNELDQLGKGPLSEGLTRAFITLSGASKVSKTVLSWVTQVRNLTGNTSIAMANGLHVEFARAMATEEGLVKKSFRDVLEGLGWAESKGGNEKFVRKMINLGIMDDSANAEELQAAIKAIGLETKVDKLPEALRKMAEAGLYTFRASAGLYRSGDDVWKVMAFKMERNRYEAAFRLTGQIMDDDALDKHVAEIVRRTWPTFSMVPDYIQKLRRYGGFISFPAEMYRSTLGIIEQASMEMKSSNRMIRDIGRQRAIGLATTLVIPTSVAATTGFFTGVSRKEEDAMRTVLPYWSRNSTLIQTQKLHDGKFGVFDASYLLPQSYFTDPITALLRGEDGWPAAKQMFDELIDPFLSGSPVVSEVVKAIRKQDDVPMHSWPLRQAIVRSLTPGTVDQLLRVMTGMTASRQPLSRWKEFIAMVTGIRGATVDVREALSFQAWAFKSELGKQDDELVRAERKGGTNRMPLQEEIFLPRMRYLVQGSQEKVWRNMWQFVAAVQTLGISESEVRRILREAKISRENTNLLIEGAAAGLRER